MEPLIVKPCPACRGTHFDRTAVLVVCLNCGYGRPIPEPCDPMLCVTCNWPMEPCPRQSI
jgi:hypothetical protein